MTRLAVIGDIHGTIPVLEQVVEAIGARGADGVLLVGDLGRGLGRGTRFNAEQKKNYAQSLKDVMGVVGRLALPVAWVPGNHDPAGLKGPGNADGRCVEVAGLRVVGIGGAGPDRRGWCYEWQEEDIRALQLPEADILLAHAPPARTILDWVPRAACHAGSEALRERAFAHRGLYVCGHIHESPGILQLGHCLCMNVGGLGRPFGRAQLGWVERSQGIDRVELHDLTTGVRREAVRSDEFAEPDPPVNLPVWERGKPQTRVGDPPPGPRPA